MKDILLSVLRNKQTTQSEFRMATERLGAILAYEASLLLERKKIEIETPLAHFPGSALKNGVVFIPIMRSGLALLPAFLDYYLSSKVGFIGMKRDEKTARPHLYYSHLPTITPDDDVLVLDPMIATGGSAIATLKILQEIGIHQEKLILVSILGANEGVKEIRKELPKVRIVLAQEDSELNAHKFIMPGLGDFGDRYFGTL